MDREKLASQLNATSDRDKIDREHEVTVLRTQVSGLRQEIDSEKAERPADMMANKLQLPPLDGQLTQQIRELRHNLDEKQSDRVAMCEHMERSCSNLRIAVDINKAAEDAITKGLEEVVRLNSQAVEAETKERINTFDKYNRSTAEVRTSRSALRTGLWVRRTRELRRYLWCKLQFKDYKTALENEMADQTAWGCPCGCLWAWCNARPGQLHRVSPMTRQNIFCIMPTRSLDEGECVLSGPVHYV